MGLAQKLIELLGLNMAADGIQNTDQGKSFQQEYVDPAMQAGANFLNRLIPEAAASTLPEPQVNYNQPEPTPEQVFATPQQPQQPQEQPIYLPGTTTLPPAPGSPDMQGINQDMAGFAQIQGKQPNPAAKPLYQAAQGMMNQVDPNKELPPVFASQDDIMKGAIANVGLTSIQTTDPKKAQEDPSFFENVGGALKDFFGDERKMLILASAFNTLRYQPDAQLEAGIQKRLATLDANRMKTQTVQQLMKTGTPEALQAAEAIRLGMDPKVAIKRMQEYGEFELLSKDEITRLGLDPRKTYNRNKRTGKITATGGGDTYLNMGQGKLAEAIYKDIQTQRATYREDALKANSRLSAFNRIGSILKSTPTGGYEQTKQQVRDALSKMGLSRLIDVNAYADAQSLEAATNLLVAEELRANKGPQTDFDARFAGTYVPRLGATPAANQEIVKYGKSSAMAQALIGKAANQLRSSDPDVEQKAVEINDIAMSIPTVIFASENSPPLYFSEFAEKHRKDDPMDVLRAWVQMAYGQ
jgi:hypothetical protein